MSNQVQETLRLMFKSDGPRILFGKGVFKKGQNYTVRYGEDYAERKDIKLGEIYPLGDTVGNHLAEGVITHIVVCRMRDIPNEVFKNEHDPDCHNPICLFDEMHKVYPDKEINRDTIVTCLGFTILA